MRTIKFAVITALVCTSALNAQLGGFIETYNRYWLEPDSGRWTWNETRLQLQLEGNPSENLHYYAEFRIRGFGFPFVSSISDLQRKDKSAIFPWSLELREAYADIYGFILPELDLRVGRQVVAWGTADKLNPTSNISPYDLEDFFDFGAKLGVNGVRATYSLEPVAVEFDFVPVFTPATLPPKEFSNALMGSGFGELPPGMTITEMTDHVALPEPKIDTSSEFGLKVSTTAMDWDISASYFYGYDGLPMQQALVITPLDTLGTVALDLTMAYPRYHVLGADFAGSLFNIGIWGEAAAFIPKSDFVFTQTMLTPMGEQVIGVDTLLEKGKPFVKFVLGGDYTFKNGLYVNTQFVHGFLHERGDSLHDYLVMRIEKKFLNDQLKLAPVSFAATVSDWDEPKENYGLAWIPEIAYMPTDNIELKVGAFVLDGKGENIFANLKDRDELFLRVKLTF